MRPRQAYRFSMDRAEALRELMTRGTEVAPEHCRELAEEVGMLAADLLVVAGHRVPEDVLPPTRKSLREFAYRASLCDHEQMARLMEFIHALPDAGTEDGTAGWEPVRAYVQPEPGRFAVMLAGLMRVRGFTPKSLPFMGLSRSTIHGALGSDDRDQHRWFRLHQMAGPLGWRLTDLLAVAEEPESDRTRYTMHCHHLGDVFIAAIRLTDGQLAQAAWEAHQLNGAQFPGAWREMSPGFAKECPDLV